MKLHLKFHGVAVDLDFLNDFSELRKILSFEFKNFMVTENTSPAISIVISKVTPPLPPKRLLFTTAFCKVFGLENRICVYPSGHILQIRRTGYGFTAELNGQDGSEIYDILRMYILSATGELLDMQGIHRLHCLGIHYHNQNILLSASSGGGKSFLAAQIIAQKTEAAIYSDETCLIDKSGQIAGLPLPVALKDRIPAGLDDIFIVKRISGERKLVQIPKVQVTGFQRIHKIFVVTHWDKKFRAMKAPLMIRWVFAMRVVLGLGNMQMKEFMIRTDSILSLLDIATSRFKRALYLLSHAELFHVQLQKNSDQNLQELLQYIDGLDGSTQKRL